MVLRQVDSACAERIERSERSSLELRIAVFTRGGTITLVVTHNIPHSNQDWQHIATFNAMADRIVPADDLPGAVASGAASIILLALDHELADHKDEIEQFLEMLDQQSIDTHGVPFAAMSVQDQDAMLRKVEKTPVFRFISEHISTAYWSTPAGQRAAGFEVRG